MLTSVFSKLTKYGLFVIVLFLEIAPYACGDEYCYVDSECNYNTNSHERFLLYDVNPPEGFNLRRDVYMRFAILAHKLKHSKHENLQHFKLVLPPWSHLYHWKYTPVAEQIPWGLYFDLLSLKTYAPVIEMYEFFQAMNRTSAVVIDEVYVLQHFKDMFETGNFKNKMQIEECAENYQIHYFFYKNLTSHNVKCLSYHGPATKLSQLLQKSSAKVILLHHAEVALHEMFGDKLYWECRRSMRFSTELRDIAAQFRRKFLNSTDKVDNTILPEKWQDEKSTRDAKGGPYLSVHIRRQDFLRGRSHQVPTIDSIAQQITKLLEKLNLTQVFIATDASEDEYNNLVQKIPHSYKTVRYVPNNDVKIKYKDGGVAIIEQIICSYARHFVGTHESTFSFRIQEEREILGFPVATTFNSFCKNGDDCPQPSVWKIVH